METLQKRGNYITQEIIEQVAVLWLDQPGEKVNKVSEDMADIFAPYLSDIEHNPDIEAVVLISKKKDFIAGADIENFLTQGPGDAARVSTRGHALLNRIAKSQKPFVAALQGATMGAGLEIALACRGRIAANAPDTALALPEVRLGILPGGGGTQRLPRLIGIQHALNMMLTGNSVYAKKALKLGLVDKLTAKENLLPRAIAFAKSLIRKPISRKSKLSIFSRIIESIPFTRNLIYKKAEEMVLRQSRGNYPAPLKIIECVRMGMEQGMEAGALTEIQEFDNLVQTPVSRQLIHLFFAVTGKKKNPYKALAKEITHLGVIGAGKMGTGISQICLQKELGVSIVDKSLEPIEKAVAKIKKALARKARKGAISKEKSKALFQKLAISTEYDILGFCNLVIESIEENLGSKQEILAKTEEATEDDCIFASNTSTLSIREIAKNAKRPGQVIGLHYFPPVEKVPFVEIVVPDQTHNWVTATVIELAITQNKSFILVADSPGFYVARLLAAYLNETVLMIEEGARLLPLENTISELGFASGPLTTLDEVGLDFGAKVSQSGLMEEFKKRGVLPSKLLPIMVEDGFLGKRNKTGFYKYHRRSGKKISGAINHDVYKFIDEAARKTFTKEEITDRLVMTLVNEAARCLEEGVIQTPEDGDLGAVLGLGFPPFLGGPFRYMDSLGIKQVVKKMWELDNLHGIRFKPAEILVANGEVGKSFYDTQPGREA